MFTSLHFDELDSSNLEARRLIEAGQLVKPTVLYTDIQTAGRGSRGRSWASSIRGNLYTSYVFPINDTIPQPHLYLYAVTLAVYNVIVGLCPETASIEVKWPNDVLVNQHKICGMLHEIAYKNGTSYFIAGIGLNIVGHPPAEQTRLPATNLHECDAFETDRYRILALLGTQLENTVSLLDDTGFDAVLSQLNHVFYRYGDMIQVRPDNGTSEVVSGRFDHIDNSGALVLKTAEGVIRITAGDIFPGLAPVRTSNDAL